MADEISTVLKAEMDGVVIVVKASVKAAQHVIQLLKALGTHMHESHLLYGGSLSFKNLNEVSETTPPVMMIPDELKNEWKSFCKKNGVRYHMLADLNAADGKFPVCIASQDVSKVEAYLKDFYQNNISESEKIMKDYDLQINEFKEQLVSATPEERKDYNLKIEHLEQAKDEVKSIFERDTEELSKNDHTMTFQGYLATGKNTTVEKDPKGVVDDLSKGGQSVPVFEAKDIFKPIRSEALVPDSKINFIIPDTGAMVTRTFHKDDNGLYYSKYFFHDKNQNQILDSENNEPIVFSDQYVTTDEWFNNEVNNSNFKDLLDQTGILEGTKCEYYDNQEALEKALNRYSVYYENINHKNNSQDQSFSNADVEEEVKYASTQSKKSAASAANGAESYSFTVPADKVFQKDGKVTVVLNDNNMLSFDDITLNKVDSNNVSFSIKSTDKVLFEDKNNIDLSRSINSKEAFSIFNKDKSDSINASVLSNDKAIGNVSGIKGVK